MYLVTIVIINLAMISDGKVICWTKLTSKPDINRKKQSIYIRTMNNSGDCNVVKTWTWFQIIWVPIINYFSLIAHPLACRKVHIKILMYTGNSFLKFTLKKIKFLLSYFCNKNKIRTAPLIAISKISVISYPSVLTNIFMFKQFSMSKSWRSCLKNWIFLN